MRLGVIGLGNIGAFHASTLLSVAEVDLVVTDVNAERAERFCADVKSRRVVTAPTVDALLGSGVEAVVVASTSDSHASLTAACVEAGLPVFCEKPIARTANEAIELVRRVGTSEVPVQVGFQRRHDAAFLAVRTAVSQGDLGVLSTVRCATLDPEPPLREYVALSGGIFRDCAIHDFDMIRWISGREVIYVYATGSNQGASFFREYGDVDLAASILVLEGGAIGLVSNSRYNGRGYDVRIEAHGSKDSVASGTEIWQPERPSVQATRHGAAFERFGDAYRQEMHTFIEVASGRCVSPCTIVDGLEATLIADACNQSMVEGRPIYIQELRDELAK